MSPDGSLLFVSNRGANYIAVFNIDTLTGIPRLYSWISAVWVRYFAYAPDKTNLIVASRDANNFGSVQSYRWDGMHLNPVGSPTAVYTPVTIAFNV